jgi:hypothetical protein
MTWTATHMGGWIAWLARTTQTCYTPFAPDCLFMGAQPRHRHPSHLIPLQGSAA